MTADARTIRARLAPLAAGAVVIAAVGLLPFTTCPVRLVTGAPCPGCGLTRASLALLRGDVAASLRWHPMALASAALVAAAVALAVALPEGRRAWGRFAWGALVVWVVGSLAVWALRLAGTLPTG